MLKDFFSSKDSSQVDSLIDRILEDMNNLDPGDSDYLTRMASLERLYELKAKDRREPIDRDVLVAVGGNLLAVLAIVAYEQKHVMTSKAMALIRAR